jgi:hypothetical protein
MAFDVYPVAPATPLIVAAGGSSSLIGVTERSGLDPVTAQNLMFIRAAKSSDSGVASGAPHPTIRLKAGSGPAVDVETHPVSIFGQAGGADPLVATATLSVEPNEVYLVEVEVEESGMSWQIQFVNNDLTRAHGFTWVVADDEEQARQPWIDVPDELGFSAVPGRVDTQPLPIANLGTGPLEITDSDESDLGAGFVLLTVTPRVVGPSGRGEARIAFTGADTPGTTTIDCKVESNDTSAGNHLGHSQRVRLRGTTRQRSLVEPGDILVANSNEPFLFRVDPRIGTQAIVTKSGVFENPWGVEADANGNIWVIAVKVDGSEAGVFRMDRVTGAHSVLISGDVLALIIRGRDGWASRFPGADLGVAC